MFSAGTTILEKGYHSPAVYFIKSNSVKVESETDGVRDVAALLMPSSFFGERSILFDTPLDFHYSAFTTSKTDG